MWDDVCTWLHCVVLPELRISSHHVGHPLRLLNMAQNAAYHIFLDRFVVIGPLNVFSMCSGVSAILICDALSVHVACFSSLGDSGTKITASIVAPFSMPPSSIKTVCN